MNFLISDWLNAHSSSSNNAAFCPVILLDDLLWERLASQVNVILHYITGLMYVRGSQWVLEDIGSHTLSKEPNRLVKTATFYGGYLQRNCTRYVTLQTRLYEILCKRLTSKHCFHVSILFSFATLVV